MKRTKMLFRPAGLWTVGMIALALSFIAIAAGCGNFQISNDDVSDELAGIWYSTTSYDFAFEITLEGKGYITQRSSPYTVTVSGHTVYFKDDNGSSKGSFDYSITKGEMTITYGMGYFRDIQSSSPLIKSDAKLNGIPVELVGKWYTKDNHSLTPDFEITPAGSMTISGSQTSSYRVRVNGNTVTVSYGMMKKGGFSYSFIYGELFIINGTDDCEGLSDFSPFIKKR